MRRALRTWMSGTALAGICAMIATPADAASATAQLAPAASATAVATHATTGCAGAVVRTPRSGQTMTAAAADAPPALDGFFATAAQHHATWLPTMNCTISAKSHALLPTARTRQTNATYASGNWSGYQITEPGVQVAQGGWTIPAVSRPNPGYSPTGAYYSSTWSGMGGGENSGTGALVQAGTSGDVSATGATDYYPWWEIVGGTGDTGGEVAINNLAVGPGITVGITPYYDPADSTAYFAVCNMTANICLDFSHPSSAPGTSAEWIEEAPTVGGRISALADFGSLTFSTACWVQTWPGSCVAANTGASLASIALEAYLFGNPQPYTLATPGPFGPTGRQFTIPYIQP